ncbi:hypothetical protein N9Y26_01215 [bacterium]|nr:hypothetical protein [bacterium]
MNRKPFIEVNFGVTNILKFIRVDMVRRLNYLDDKYEASSLKRLSLSKEWAPKSAFCNSSKVKGILYCLERACRSSIINLSSYKSYRVELIMEFEKEFDIQDMINRVVT